jgi:DNA-directed RNA polymerase alpha subunit
MTKKKTKVHEAEKLRSTLFQIESNLAKARKQFSAEIERIERSLAFASRGLAAKQPKEITDKLAELPWDDFVSSLGVRARKSLTRLGVTKSSDLSRLTLTILQEVKNCGRTTVLEITNRLHEYGFELPVTR